jgi:hypothetical protein
LANGCARRVAVRQWIKLYPWTALGISAAAGFTTATVVTPPRGVPIGEKWAHLRTRFCSAAKEDLDEAAGTPAKGGRIAATILESLFDVTKLLIESLIIAALRHPTASQAGALAAETTPRQRLDCGSPPSGHPPAT